MNSKVTTRPGIYAGWRAVSRAMNKGFGWESISDRSVLGFTDLDECIAHFFRENDKCWTVRITK